MCLNSSYREHAWNWEIPRVYLRVFDVKSCWCCCCFLFIKFFTPSIALVDMFGYGNDDIESSINSKHAVSNGMSIYVVLSKWYQVNRIVRCTILIGFLVHVHSVLPILRYQYSFFEFRKNLTNTKPFSLIANFTNFFNRFSS